MVKNGQKLSKKVENGQKWTKIIEKGRKWSKKVKNEKKTNNLPNFWRKLSFEYILPVKNCQK